MTLWALEWNSRSVLDGEGHRTHFIHENLFPKLFKTRHEARAWANEEYGYIKTRPDLRAQPHAWRIPRPVRVKLALENKQ